MLLGSSWWTAGARDGEMQIEFRMLMHEPLHDGAFTRSRWCTEDDELAFLRVALARTVVVCFGHMGYFKVR